MADPTSENRSVEAVTASRTVMAATVSQVGRGLAGLFGDPASDELPPALADLLAALDRPAAPAPAAPPSTAGAEP